MLIVKPAKTSGHHAAAVQVTHNLAMVAAIDYRQASDVIAEHFCGRFGHKFVGVSDHQPSAPSFPNGHRSGKILVERTKQIAAGDDAGQLSGVVENQQSLVASHGGIMLRDARRQRAYRSTS